MPYETWVPKKAPTWLQGPAGKAMLATIGRIMDGGRAKLVEATKARFPGAGPADALDEIGADRSLDRGPTETEGAYRARLRDAWDLWRTAGSHRAMLLAIKAAGLPTGATGATVIQHNGRYAQLDGSDNLVLGTGMIAVNRMTLLGTAPGNLPGFTLDLRDQFYSKFAVVFPVDVPTLREGTAPAARLNSAVAKWRPAKAAYVGAYVIEAGGGWDWPITQTWNDGTNWDSDTVHFIPPA